MHQLQELKEGNHLPCCQNALVEVSETMALYIYIMNVLFAGVGTIMSGFKDRKGLNYTAIRLGFLQILLAPILVGWIWGIMHAHRLFKYT